MAFLHKFGAYFSAGFVNEWSGADELTSGTRSEFVKHVVHFNVTFCHRWDCCDVESRVLERFAIKKKHFEVVLAYGIGSTSTPKVVQSDVKNNVFHFVRVRDFRDALNCFLDGETVDLSDKRIGF